jgi:CubicO group peptidase (beta-lactamase class C family)
VIFSLLLAFVPLSSARAQSGHQALSPASRSELDTYIARIVRETPLPGLAVAVVSRDGIIYMRGFGYRDLEHRLPVTADTLFAAASTTKAFTAFTAATLVDRGLIQWDTPVHARMPAFELSDANATQTVTLRQILSHNSGMSFHDLLWYSDSRLTRAAIVRRLRYLPMARQPGSGYDYNNLMFAAAGEYLRHVAGVPVDRLIARTIFAPLRMDRATFSIEQALRDPDHAEGYDYDLARGYHYRVARRDMTAMAAAGGINASVRDYAKWLQLQLNNGRIGHRRLISEENLATTRSRQVLISESTSYPEIGAIWYAMGWNSDTYRGMPRLHHNGITDGFTSRMTLYPEQGIGIIVFVNQSNNFVPPWLSLDIADRLFGLERLNWVSRIAARQSRPSSDPLPPPRPLELSLPVQSYLGVYDNPAYGRITIESDGAGLTARLNDVQLWLEPAGLNTFKTNTSTSQNRFFSELLLAFQAEGPAAPTTLTLKIDAQTGPAVFTRVGNHTTARH